MYPTHPRELLFKFVKYEDGLITGIDYNNKTCTGMNFKWSFLMLLIILYSYVHVSVHIVGLVVVNGWFMKISIHYYKNTSALL